MLTTLRKSTTKSVITRAVIALIVVVIAIGLVHSSILALIKGPVTIDGDTDFEQLEGQYVEYTANLIVDEFVRQTTRKEGSTKETLKNISYLVLDWDYGYIFGAELPKKNEERMNANIEETWSWLYEEIDETSFTETFRGTWKELTGKRLQYFKETITEDMGEEFMQLAVPYYIDTNSIGGDLRSQTVAGLIFAAAALLYMIYVLFRHFTGSYDKNIRKFLQNNPGVTMEQIEADFQAAQKVSSNIWVGRRFTIYTSGIYAEILDNSKQVWAYYYRRTGRNSVSQLRVYNVNKGMNPINCSEAEAKQIMEIYIPVQPQMLFGYDKAWEKLFDKDFQGFLNLRYNAAVQKAREENFESDPSRFERNEDFDQETSQETAQDVQGQNAQGSSPEAETAKEAGTEEKKDPFAFDTSLFELNSSTSSEAEKTDGTSTDLGSDFGSIGSSYGSDLGSSFGGFSSFDTVGGTEDKDEDKDEDKNR